MKNIKYFLIILVTVLYGCSGSYNQPGNSGAGLPQKSGNIKFLVPWGNGQTTVLCVVEEIDSSGYRLRNLSFFSDSISQSSKLYSHNDPDYPVAVLPLKDNAGNLLTIWQSGVAYHFKVYSFRDGNVTSVLESGSGSYPELFYEKKESEDLSILVTNTDLVKNKKTREKDLLPVSATLYRWNGSKYISIPNIAWTKRFNPAK